MDTQVIRLCAIWFANGALGALIVLQLLGKGF